jgi:hypothetical protein
MSSSLTLSSAEAKLNQDIQEMTLDDVSKPKQFSSCDLIPISATAPQEAKFKQIFQDLTPPLSSLGNCDSLSPQFIATLIVQEYKANGITDVACDWDLTILKIHTSALLRHSSDFIPKNSYFSSCKWFWEKDEKVKESKKDLLTFLSRPIALTDYANHELFREVVIQSVAAGIRFHILSFGYRVIIRMYIELLFGSTQTIFNDENVVTPSDFGFFDFTYDLITKLPMLKRLKDHFVCTIQQGDDQDLKHNNGDDDDKKKIVFYDDSTSDIGISLLAGYKYSILVAEGGLLDKDSYSLLSTCKI